jgi:hypothetical protein
MWETSTKYSKTAWTFSVFIFSFFPINPSLLEIFFYDHFYLGREAMETFLREFFQSVLIFGETFCLLASGHHLNISDPAAFHR